MPAAQDLFEKPDEHLQRPAIRIAKRDHLGGHIEQIRGDAQDAIGTGTAGATADSAPFFVRRGLHAHQPHRVIGTGRRF